MMRRVLRTVYLVFLSVITLNVAGQEGGPPMLTDDARVTDLKEWEINTSINTSVADGWMLSVPHIDLNYGLLQNLQLKAEAPFQLRFHNKEVRSELGDVILGVKYRFLDEEKYFVSAATFPQVSVTGTTGYLIPVFIEKTIGRFLIGQGTGYFLGNKSPNQLQLGTLVGYRASEKLHVMLEYFSETHHVPHHQNLYNGYVNFGFRHPLTDLFTLMGSFGTQVVTPAGMEREHFISWLGIQTIF